MTWVKADRYVERIGRSCSRYDQVRARAWCDVVLHRLRKSSEPFPERAGGKLLSMLRRHRYFDEMMRLAEAMIQSDRASVVVRRQYAQGLIEVGHLSAARVFLEALITDTSNNPRENAEAYGLLGRVWKQIYTDGGEDAPVAFPDALQASLDAYDTIFRRDRVLHRWHGINVVALLTRAERDGVKIECEQSSREIAIEILTGIERDFVGDGVGAWDLGTAAECCLALDDAGGAMKWCLRYVEEAVGDAFALGSTLRQFETVWGILDRGGEYARIVTLLRSHLLQARGGEVKFVAPGTRPSRKESAADGAQYQSAAGGGIAVDGGDFEAVYGAATVTVNWWLLGLSRSASVARIEDQVGRGIGTGFVVRAKDLSDHLDDELLLLTNSHVVSDDDAVFQSSTTPPLHPEDATLVFTGRTDALSHSVDKVVWESPPGVLDAALLRLDPPIEEVDPVPIARRVPVLGPDTRVYVIGHPAGGTLSFSIQDNVLKNVGDKHLHYRAPTLPGSSGSGVFNASWKLIGLHHIGNRVMTTASKDAQKVNEGIRIDSIRRAIDERRQ